MNVSLSSVRHTTTTTTIPYGSNNNEEEESETAFDWIQRSRSNTSPLADTIDAFLCRSRRRRRKNDIHEGTGIRFIDQLLQSTNDNNKNIVLEITGGTGTGKTALLMTLAASFAAATHWLEERPQVLIFDSEYGIHTANLASTVRAAIIRRWQRNASAERNEETSEIERHITSSLTRIHISHPQDYGIGFVSSLEALRHTISSSDLPILLLVDSLGAFEQTSQKLEDVRKGLSGKSDFLRQLTRLIRDTNVIVIATKQQQHGYFPESWNKLVTHKLSLERVKCGTVEDRQGFEFVALLKEINVVIPFSVTSGGILC